MVCMMVIIEFLITLYLEMILSFLTRFHLLHFDFYFFILCFFLGNVCPETLFIKLIIYFSRSLSATTILFLTKSNLSDLYISLPNIN